MQFSITLPSINSVVVSDVKLFFIENLSYNQLYCIEILKKFGLLAMDPICCNESMSLLRKNQLSDGYVNFCTSCKKQKSIRSGSFFQRSHLKLWEILKIIYLYSHDVSSQSFIYKEIGISSRTIVDWKSFVRDVYVNHLLEHSNKVGGDGKVVQIDESLICKRKYNVGRILSNQDQWIVGGIDESGNVFMELTTIRNEPTLTDIILRWVERGSIIWTDCWKGYRRLDHNGYLHMVVNHSENFVSMDGVHTNRIEATWGACKRKHSHIRNKKPNLIPGYLAEYIFKKKFKENIFEETIKAINCIYKF